MIASTACRVLLCLLGASLPIQVASAQFADRPSHPGCGTRPAGLPISMLPPAFAQTAGMRDAASFAADVDPKASAGALQFFRTQVQGKELQDRIDRVLHSMTWHRDLSKARKRAAASGRPLLWIQALGDLDGFA